MVLSLASPGAQGISDPVLAQAIAMTNAATWKTSATVSLGVRTHNSQSEGKC